MKRMWLGVGLLLTLLAAGLLVTGGMHGVCIPISRDLRKAAAAALQEEWTQAEALAQRADERWKVYRNACAAVTDHEPMEEVEAMFETLLVFRACGDSVGFAQCCIQLASMTEAMADSQAVHWWSVF